MTVFEYAVSTELTLLNTTALTAAQTNQHCNDDSRRGDAHGHFNGPEIPNGRGGHWSA